MNAQTTAINLTDPIYEAARNRLIPEAERYANSLYGYYPTGTEQEKATWCDKWNAAFHSMMNKLAKDKKII